MTALAGSDAIAVTLDVADEKSVADAIEEVASKCGGIDILVNNAGINIRAPVQDLKLEQWHRGSTHPIARRGLVTGVGERRPASRGNHGAPHIATRSGP